MTSPLSVSEVDKEVEEPSCEEEVAPEKVVSCVEVREVGLEAHFSTVNAKPIDTIMSSHFYHKKYPYLRLLRVR